MIRFQNPLYYLIPTFLLLIIVAGCNSETDIGMSILPNDDELIPQYTDTIISINSTIANDSLVTTNLSAGLLGVVKDKYFGFTSAGFVTQMRPYYNSFFGENAVADSMYITLAYKDTSSASIYTDGGPRSLKLEIYRLRLPLPDANTYYSNTNMDLYDTLLLSEHTVTINPKDTLIKLKLPTFLAQMIVDLDSIKTQDDVEKVLPGIYIKPAASVTDGPLTFINLNNVTNSKILLFYHNDVDTLKAATLVFDTYVTKFNVYEHNYTGTEVGNAILAGNAGTHVDYIYSQGTNGVRALLQFPEKFNLENVVILKAELALDVFETTDILYRKPPQEMILIKESPDGLRGYLPEYDAGFGVIYDSDNKKYTFNVTKLVQNWIDGTDDARKLYLLPAKDKVEPNRVVIKNTPGAIKLKVSYIKE